MHFTRMNYFQVPDETLSKLFLFVCMQVVKALDYLKTKLNIIHRGLFLLSVLSYSVTANMVPVIIV